MDPFREAIVDHYNHPRRKGSLEDADVHYHDANPFCGDEVTIELKIEDDKVVDAAFDGRGCAISQASASTIALDIVFMAVMWLFRAGSELAD